MHGIHDQSDSLALPSQNDDASLIVGGAFHVKSLSQIDNRNQIAAQIDDAFQKGWRFWQRSDLAVTENFLDPLDLGSKFWPPASKVTN